MLPSDALEANGSTRLPPTRRSPNRIVNPPEARRGDTEAGPFPADVAEFLLEFSIGVHRHAMYPPNHPSLRPTARAIMARLERVLADRDDLRLGVLRDRFVCEDHESDPGHAVLSELAHRLHDHEIAALRFAAGVEPPELRGLLDHLAPEVDRGAPALGALPVGERPSWPHVSIEALHYDELVLDDDPDPDDEEARVRTLWASLVRSAMGEATDGAASGAGRAVAAAVANRGDDTLQLGLVAGYLGPLVEALARVDPHRVEGVRTRVSEFLSGLDPETRVRLLRTGGGPSWQQALVDAASRGLELDGLLELLEAAAEASGQTISTSMTRLLAKMSTHGSRTDPASTRRADDAVRENVRALLRDWTLEDPNPEAYSGVLDALARTAHGGPGREVAVTDGTLALRVLTMAVELDQWTRRSAEALRTALDAGRLGAVYGLVDSLPDLPGTRPIVETLRKPAWIRRAVAPDHLDAAALARLADEAGAPAVPALMDGLVTGRTREARRVTFDTLTRLGDAVIPEAEARLPSPYWYVTRNLLNLLAVVPGRPSIDPTPYLAHEDRRVRRAALPVALKDPDRSEAALIRALSDRDERVAQLALVRTRGRETPAVLTAVVGRVVLAARSPELRILGIRTLAGLRSPVVREGLLETVVRELRAGDDDARGAVAAAALEALKTSWPGAPDVLELLDEAATSRYAAVRRAAEAAP